MTQVRFLDGNIPKKIPCRKSESRSRRVAIRTRHKMNVNGHLAPEVQNSSNAVNRSAAGRFDESTNNSEERINREERLSFSDMDQTDHIHDQPSTSNHRVPDVESVPNSVLQTGTIFKDFGEKHSSHCFEEPAPSYYDLFPDTQYPSMANSHSSIGYAESLSSLNSQSTSSFSQPMIGNSSFVLPDDNLNPLGVKPYAITLFPFNAQFPNELSFTAGEVVHLVKRVDTEWVEGTIDDARGIFPASYVNIIVDCTDVSNDQAEQTEQEVELRIPQQVLLEPGVAVRVDYTFDAQMDGDLSVSEGDVVTVVEMANEDWVSVKNKQGAIGLCPRGYLSSEIYIRPSEPEFDMLEDFVVMRSDRRADDEANVDKPKRLSEPHRPAPPAPAPGRTPLQKQTGPDKESTSLTTNSHERDDETSPTLSEKQKRADKRQNVISELVITEKEYVRDLKVTYETFNLYNPSFLESRGIDVTTLFGNIMEVIQVAEELLDLVLRAMKGCDEDYQTIAPCFLKMSDKLQSAYGKYCGNHEEALTLLKKYEDNKEIMNIFNKGIETLRRQVVCFDMSSILIKPVQRILKYPLMLYELIKCTEEDHPDRKGIEEAWKAMTNVASHINEYKLRKDLVSKYLDSEDTLMSKMTKLSIRSIAKTSSRLSAKLSATLGLTSISDDPEFEDLKRQFHMIERCAWNLSKDVEQCVSSLNDEAVCGEVLSVMLTQYLDNNDVEVRRYRDTREAIRAQFLQNLRSLIERRVTVPIKSLLRLLEGPLVLITKRYNKLLDYNTAASRWERNKEYKLDQEELVRAKRHYEALHQQLLEELPAVIEAATSILVTCTNAYVNARKLLNGKITKRYLALSECATQVSPQDIYESFLVNHNLVWNQINRGTFAESATTPTENSVDYCVQSEGQITTLKSRYPNDRLYIAKENIASTSSLDLSATKGALVAVIKKQDPMGDSSRWFVDNGIAQGFLPSRCLEPVSQIQHVNQSSNNSIDTGSSTQDLMSLDSPERVVPHMSTHMSTVDSQTSWFLNAESSDNNGTTTVETVSQPQRYQNIKPEFYYAEFDFSSEIPGTLSAARGNALKLIRQHDEMGNDQWWFMEDRVGNKGYIPRNYVMSIDSITNK